MSNSSNRIRDLFGGLVALSGASLVCWQAMLVYYLIVGRVEVGEEHPPFVVITVLIVVGILLIAAGYKLTNPSTAKSVDEN